MSTIRFADLEGQQVSNSGGTSALDEWYESIRTVPIDKLDDGSLCRACRQSLFLDHVVPIALSRIMSDPDAGDQYDGEMASTIARIPAFWWQSNESHYVEARAVLLEIMESLDDDIRQEVQSFMDR